MKRGNAEEQVFRLLTAIERGSRHLAGRLWRDLPRSITVLAVQAAVLDSLGVTPTIGAEAPAMEIALLRPAGGAKRLTSELGRPVRRRRAADLDLAALRRAAGHPGARLRFDLFEDVGVRGYIESVEWRDSGNYSVMGRLEGDGGDFVLAVEEARLSGSIHAADGRSFVIGSDVDGNTVVQELDLARFPECAGALVAPPSVEGPRPRGDGPSPDSHVPGEPDPPDFIDVLVAYTPLAELASGGPAAVRALAQRSIDETNLVYRNSGINTRVRLVWRGRTQYDETLDSHLVHLQRLTTPDDGWMDELHSIRDATGADVVSLFVDDSEAAGIGYLMQRESVAFDAFAFSVAYFFAASNNLTLAHEIGHNQGCQHDRDHATDSPVFHYAYGKRFVGDDGRQYRTVMGYLPGLRIPHFSNPNVSFQGQLTGRDNKEDNARAINATAGTVANFRPRRHQPGSVRDFDGNGLDDLATYDSLSGNWWVSLSRGSDFDTLKWDSLSPPSGWGSQVEGDFDGDGWKDVASFYPPTAEWWVSLSRGDRFETSLWQQLTPGIGWGRQQVGDFDGDGRDDIANLHDADGEWWVSVSTGTGFSTSRWDRLASPSGWTGAMVGDFNGDGRDDLANYHQPDGEWWVGVSTGTGFSTVLWDRLTSPSAWAAAVVGDFDGDGRDDLANYHQPDGEWWVGSSTGSGFATLRWAVLSPGSGWGPFFGGDFDGDGTDDIASFYAPEAQWWVGLSTGTGFTTTIWSALQPASEWTEHSSGDFDGDGRRDVASYLRTKGEWWVGLSSGTDFSTSLWETFVLLRPDVDTDGDGLADANDCDPTSADAWAVPGEVEGVMLDQQGGAGGTTRLTWSEPAWKGGTFVQYDVLRSNSPSDFGWGAVLCLETNDAGDREALDPDAPAPVSYYLVRAGNSCGEASLGTDSQGVPRSGVSCP